MVGYEERGASGKDRAGDGGVSQRDSVQEIRVANKEQIELLMRRKRAAALKTTTNCLSSLPWPLPRDIS